ncbi:small multi-drug export protein [Natribacillus halophilus]|uniref:Putative small multi-drug export protein n=1 Tax=Natribacillus halophilus TaxID=549003 RepID=A0A1G8NMA1_9BACI|nr:small multi-drug export protein [Natribacillus halophilus]SDI81324.1 Putative small multi-drug export protein [Natribacillus halophilus]
MWQEMVQDFLIQLSEMNAFLQYLGVFAIGFIPPLESFGGAAAGATVGMPFISTALISIIGNWISMMLLILPFNALLTKIRNRKSKKDGLIQKGSNKAREQYDKYGVPGVAIISPLVPSSGHIAAFASLSAGASKKRVIVWHTISMVIWGVLGIAFGVYLNYGIMQAGALAII